MPRKKDPNKRSLRIREPKEHLPGPEPYPLVIWQDGKIYRGRFPDLPEVALEARSPRAVRQDARVALRTAQESGQALRAPRDIRGLLRTAPRGLKGLTETALIYPDGLEGFDDCHA